MQNFNNSARDINECTSRGSCSVSPTIVALEELLFTFLRQLSHYLLLLDKLGVRNEKIKSEIINVLAGLVSVNEFSDTQLFTIIRNQYFMLSEAKRIYSLVTKTRGIKADMIKGLSDFSTDTTLSQAISIGEKLFLGNYKKRSAEVKNLSEILNIVIKSLCMNLIKLSDFAAFDDDAYQEILKALNLFNPRKISPMQISEQISVLAYYDKMLQLKIADFVLENFGGISKVKVSHSTRKGKAILVSGNNFTDLLNILKATQDKEIDIYTHSNLLITHALSAFKNFNNLRGHYGDSTENCILDFATFPGSILLTKNSHSSNEYLYRGRLFSKDYIIPSGVIEIEGDNYNQLIESSLLAKGFSKGKIKDDTVVGFDIKDIENQFEKISEKLSKNKIERLYFIGMDAHSELQKEYFKEFFDNLKRNEFAISFSYESERENVLTINIGNYTPLVTKLLKIFIEKYSIESEKITFVLTTCDVMSISSVIALKNLNVKNLYMAKCSPMIINPTVMETFTAIYDLNFTTMPTKDLISMRKK